MQLNLLNTNLFVVGLYLASEISPRKAPHREQITRHLVFKLAYQILRKSD